MLVLRHDPVDLFKLVHMLYCERVSFGLFSERDRAWPKVQIQSV